jgi:hypothetical protein
VNLVPYLNIGKRTPVFFTIMDVFSGIIYTNKETVSVKKNPGLVSVQFIVGKLKNSYLQRGDKNEHELAVRQ